MRNFVRKPDKEQPVDIEEQYMFRCLQLAAGGAGRVAPNPLVGAILVYRNRIIGEGFHQEFGSPHAEVNCIASVTDEDRHLIKESELYVSLEPCAHFGKTPPCSDLIIRNRIPKVVVGSKDPFPEVNGKGIEKMKNAGIEVVTGVLEAECMDMNKRFYSFQEQHRPYIILKWAQTRDHAIALPDGSAVAISNEYTNRLVHRWRSEEAAILIGTRTALLDNPSLTTRLWPGNSPIRLLLDLELKLSPALHVFDNKTPTVIFNLHRHEAGNGGTGKVANGNWYYRINDRRKLIKELLDALYVLEIQSVLIEGGAKTLQMFIDAGTWDEARVITNEQLGIPSGIKAPQLFNEKRLKSEYFLTDRIDYFVSASL